MKTWQGWRYFRAPVLSDAWVAVMPLRRGVLVLLVLAFASGGAVLRAQPVTLHGAEVPGGRFGASVALADSLLFAGAPFEEPGQAGVVYVFRRTAAGWAREARLACPLPGQVNRFGMRLAAAGRLLAVAAIESAPPRRGVVFVFERTAPGRWRRVGAVRAEPAQLNDLFGSALALSGDTLYVGAAGVTGRVEREGAVFVYARHHGGRDAWGLAGRLAPPHGVFDGRFGADLSLHGAHLVVGAPLDRVDGAAAGAIYLFRRDGAHPDGWRVVAHRPAPGGSPAASFGGRVVLREDRMLVAAPGAADPSPGTGAVHLFTREGAGPAGWREVARLAAPGGAPGDRFGETLVLGERLLAVGAPFHDARGEDAGAVYVFAPAPAADGSWQPVARLMVASGSESDHFGRALALSGRYLAVGAERAGYGAGAVYVYDLARPLTSELLSFERLSPARTQGAAAAVEAILEDRVGFLWLGTHDGLARYDGQAFRTYRHDPADTTSPTPGAVLALLGDPDDRFWVGTEDGLSRYDPRRDRFRRYVLPSEGVFPRRSVRVLFRDRMGVVWTGTNGRLYRYEAAADRFAEYAPFTGLPERLGETYISGIQQDRAGRLWVLAKDLWQLRAALYRVDVARGEVERYPLAAAWGQVGPLAIDGRDGLWIKAPAPAQPPGAPGDTLRPAGPPAGPPDEAVHWHVYEDRRGVVWIGTERGLYRRAPGAAAPTFHQVMPVKGGHAANFIRYVYEDRAGRLLLGTSDGVYWIVQPPEAAGGPEEGGGDLPAPLVLTGIQVTDRAGQRPVQPYGLDRLVLSSRTYNVAFEYAALAYRHPEQPRYRYRIEGYDRDWVEAGTRRMALYTNLPPGRYVFRVQAVAEPPAQPVGELVLPLTVRPALWQSAWFRLVVGLLAAGLLTAVYRYRVRRLVEMERLRLRIASDLHDDLSTSLSGIALMSEVVQAQPTFGPAERRQLDQIAGASRQMAERLRDIVWFIDPSHDRLEDLLLRMKDTASALLGGTACTFEVAEGTDLGALGMNQRRQIFLVYKEVLHNIARHARAGRVHVEVGVRHGTFRLCVADDGVGFEPEAAQAGIGLRSLHRRAEALGGTLHVESRPGAGTRVTLTARMA